MRAKDTPNFIANRIGTFAMMRTLDEAIAKGYTVEEVDMVFGPATGPPEERRVPDRRRRRPGHAGARRPTTATRRCPTTSGATCSRRSPVLQQLIAKKWLGAKTKQGFYKKVGDDILQLDLEDVRVRAAEEAALRFDRRHPRRRRRRREDCGAWWPGDDRAAELARTVLYETLIYSANRLGEIADSVADIDRALRWGFGWERGPFETWDALGVKATAAKMEAAGFTVPGWVQEQIAAQGEGMRFYQPDDGAGKPASSAQRGGFTPIPTDPRALSLDADPRRRRRGRAQRAARRSSIWATASSASSSTPR